MSERIDQIAERLNRDITANRMELAKRLSTASSSDGPNSDRTLSNTSLLLEALQDFYADSKSQYFPASISNVIRDRLIQAESTFAGFPPVVPEDTASNFLKNLDELYAYCLQYGLITYGFTSKAAQQQIERIRIASQSAEAAALHLSDAVDLHELEIADKLKAFGQSLAEAETDARAKVAARLDELKPSIDRLADLLDTSQKNSTDIQDALKQTRLDSNEVVKLRDDAKAAAEDANSRLSSQESEAKAALNSIAQLLLQVQNYESDAGTKQKAVTDAKAAITNQLEEITRFYGGIEKFRAEVTQTGKDTEAHLGELRNRSDELVRELVVRTAEVVSANESLVDQINDHLRKAIGASLFSAFDTRRRHISIASWVWAVLLLASVGGTIVFAFSFVSHISELANRPNGETMQWALVYARLIIVAPLAFLVAFTAKRYSSERRAEEEWAFKSAISISLDPYRDLIARMKKEGHDTVFVERLVSEIFDNPTKRLYGVPAATEASEGLDAPSVVKELLDKIPKAQ